MVALGALGLPPVAAARAQAADSPVPAGLDGAWAGAAIENGTPRLFELRFSRDARGALSTELTLPYNGYDRFPFSFAYRSGGPADGMLTGGLFGDRMDLVVDLSEGHLRGTVTTGDSVTMRVHLQKVVDVAAPAPSAEDVRFVAGTDTLAGTLLLPSGVVRPAVAVLVAGRGAESRTSMLGWGRLLTRFGVAASAYDERGGRADVRPRSRRRRASKTWRRPSVCSPRVRTSARSASSATAPPGG